MGFVSPELSIVIPTYNEEHQLPQLLAALVNQRDIRLEVIVVDGGSQDQTCLVAEQCLAAHNTLYKIIHCSLGRACQMNAGADCATGLDLLFLHADSGINDPNLLLKAKQFLDKERVLKKTVNVAGHFGIGFVTTMLKSSAYYFYEAKSRLNRENCINGDQGFWLSKTFFKQLGGFDESLGYMEDARLSKQVFERGVWVTLPGTMLTSARRFEREGLTQRQTLNALLCNFDYIDFPVFYAHAANAYKNQDKTERLDLLPFFCIIHKLSVDQGCRKFLMYWYKTGRYVAANFWQIAFWGDWFRHFKRSASPVNIDAKFTRFYDRWLSQLFTSVVGNTIMMMATLVWFYGGFFIMKVRQ